LFQARKYEEKNMAKAFYSTPELAELLGVFHSTVRRWIERDQVKGFRVGRNYKIPASEVMRMLDDHGLPLPEVMTSDRPKGENQVSTLSLKENDPGSILQRLLVVDDVKAPALVFRRDTILGTNQRFADLVGYGQIDLIGARLSEVVDGVVDGMAQNDRKIHSPFVDKGPRKRSARLKTGDGTLREFLATVDGVDGVQDALLLVVTGEKTV
jgi:excisionase family DNA binding protein